MHRARQGHLCQKPLDFQKLLDKSPHQLIKTKKAHLFFKESFFVDKEKKSETDEPKSKLAWKSQKIKYEEKTKKPTAKSS